MCFIIRETYSAILERLVMSPCLVVVPGPSSNGNMAMIPISCIQRFDVILMRYCRTLRR